MTEWTAQAEPPRSGENGSPAVRRLSALLATAAEEGASDLHLEPERGGLRVRMRVDGHLRDLEPPPAALVPAMLTRIRLLSRVDLAERRLPQDGRFTWTLDDGETVDVRSSFLPAARGEKIALRLLRGRRAAPSLADLGLGDRGLERVVAALARPNGLIVVAGPTGSGKSTTLHSALVHLRDATRALASVEDPVEFDIAGVCQVAVDEEVGRTFAVVLRALLRQDPDVLMIGEIRDDESARIACRAALTGHLVLTSLHAAHAREALLRLPEIGVAEYLVRATVTLVVAQRLVRRLCDACSARGPVRARSAEWFVRAKLPPPETLPFARGCDRCRGRGYAGRLALFELADGIDEAPAPFAPGSLGAAGLARVLAFETTLEEVLTQCPQPHDGHEPGTAGGTP